jgi:hypothetical protein
MVAKYLSIIILVLTWTHSYSQDSLVFRHFTLLNTSYSADKIIPRDDSFATKKYTLVNDAGDSLFLFQRLPLSMKNGEAKIYEMGLTETFTHLRTDSVYTIIFISDKYGSLKNTEYIKHRKIDFLLKGRDGISKSTYDTTNNLIIHKIVRETKPPLQKDVSYLTALDSLKNFLENEGNSESFKKAVFLVENTFLDDAIPYDVFNERIKAMAAAITLWMQYNPERNYRAGDSVNFFKNRAIYHFVKDTTTVIIGDEEKLHLPYRYSFHDFWGKEDWRNMFVTKLIATHLGNCHSLPYLYKMLADELKATCWLGLAPNHIYIKNRSKKSGWYNTELTSGSFPIDAWITASGYVPLQAIQNGIYMDTLSNQQAIALCVLDLAKGYEFQTKNYYDGFIIQCCDLVLQYHPVNVQAMLLKAETMKRVYEKQKNAQDEAAAATYKAMEGLYTKLFELGYREMPEKMYRQWLESVVKEKEKYANRKL